MKEQKKNDKQLSRRKFLCTGASVAAFTIVPRHVLAESGRPAPSDRVNVGGVGCGGQQGGGDVNNLAEGNDVVALCDVDEAQGAASFTRYPNARLYKDFRRMLDKEQKNLQAINVTIPDHMHASVAIRAMERGIACYVEKPLTQSVWEARMLINAHKKYPRVATQMGNQGYSAVATRVATEIIWNGELGDIKEVHSWNANARNRGRGLTAWPPAEPVPPTLNWDLWTGRAPEHTYSSQIHTQNWRAFLDYGTMMIGDWGIHQLGPANWSLGLSYIHPTSVTCTAVEGGVPGIIYPSYSCIYEFPERPHPYKKDQKMPPVKIYWSEGTLANKQTYTIPEGLTQQDFSGHNEVFVGTKGYMGTSGRGESVSLIPRSKQEGYQTPAEVIERSPGHFQDFIRAVKTGKEACSNFAIGGPYAEWMLLGAISWRFPNEKLLWDGENLRFTNNEKANGFVRPYMRKDWELQDITI
jgi:predicted dehydrogenase